MNSFSFAPQQHTQSRTQKNYIFVDEHNRHKRLKDLLGTLKISETGTALYLRNKASFRREEQPAIEDSEDYTSALPPLMPAPGLKIRIPPELMPDEETALHYFDLYFSHLALASRKQFRSLLILNDGYELTLLKTCGFFHGCA
ncbi:hypothetical protein CDV31_016753 [Fusarium ambrosium]|uniref:Uncharacterized protein n=1 Tax=Fusarium ambrosium TaxID=131363 RepID=A0A428S2K6_9HYPO|nr:hypothetical protein CDV31_016753 [Fusarium ambrosium]